MRGDVVYRIYGLHGGREKEYFFGAFLSRAEAEAEIASLRTREMAPLAWLVSPMFLVVAIVTLLALVAIIYSDSAKSLWITAAVLILAWSWLSYSLAGLVAG
jgi:hypothetical protein